MTNGVDEFSATLWVAALILTLLMVRGAWRGYRRGPLRQLAGPGALTAGLISGWLWGADFGHALLADTTFPWLLRGVTGVTGLTCLTGLLVYGILWRMGRQPEGQVEAESPVLGALIGCWTGLLYFCLLVAGLASVAAVTELWQRLDQPAHWTVSLRNELSATPLTAGLKDWSPIPARPRALLRQTRRLMADPAARRRLMAQPEIRALAAHPSLYQAWGDEKVRELLNNNDLYSFIEHPKVRAVLADEALQREAEQLDLAGIVERSLHKPKN
jgi:hypothetical protein